MKVREILESVDKSNPQEPNENIFEEVKVDYFSTYQDPVNLKYYWLAAHYCTDTWVGARVYFLEDEIVAVSFQRGRKYDEQFSWISKESFTKVKAYLSSLIREDEEDLDIVDDLDQEMNDGYSITYREELIPSMHKVALLDGDKVVSVLPFTEYDERVFVTQIKPTILVEYQGIRSFVELRNLAFPLNCLPKIKTFWSEPDQEFKAIYLPFPKLEIAGKTANEAASTLRKLFPSWLSERIIYVPGN